jgi:prophage antirepressor-like protein
MSNEVIDFSSEEFGSIRAMTINGVPYFVGKDVAIALGYSKGKSLNNAIIRHVDNDDKGVTEMVTPGGKQSVTIINESGLYSLILSSKLPTAKRFKRWVTSEVLPSIRKHGAYMTPQTLQEMLHQPENMIQLLQTLQDEQKKNEELQKVNIALTEQAYEWENRSILNALVRSYALCKCNGVIGVGWNTLYKSIQYHEHINLKIRKGHSGDKKKPLIEFIREDEFPKVIKIAVAMCEKAGIDTYKIINEVNVKKIMED